MLRLKNFVVAAAFVCGFATQAQEVHYPNEFFVLDNSASFLVGVNTRPEIFVQLGFKSWPFNDSYYFEVKRNSTIGFFWLLPGVLRDLYPDRFAQLDPLLIELPSATLHRFSEGPPLLPQDPLPFGKPFVAQVTPGIYQLILDGWSSAPTALYAGLIFNVTTPIPEPNTHTLAVVGLALLSLLARRRDAFSNWSC